MQAVRKVLTTLTLAGLLLGFGTSASAAPKITITATPSSLTSALLSAGANLLKVAKGGLKRARLGERGECARLS